MNYLNKQEDLKRQITELNILREKANDEGVIAILDSNIDTLQKQLNIELSKSNYVSKRTIQEQIGIVSERIKKAELNNDLQLFQDLQKQKKALKKNLSNIQGEIKYLNLVQIKRIIKAIDLTSNTPLRDKLIISLAFELGLRAGEVTNLSLADLKLDTGEVYCRRTKGSIANYIKVSDSTLKLLKEYLKNSMDHQELLFTSSKGTQLTLQGINYLFKRYSKLAKIPKDKQHFHTLKHSRGVYLAEQGFTIQEIKYLLGHKDIKSTMIYASFSKAQKEAIYQKLESLQD